MILLCVRFQLQGARHRLCVRQVVNERSAEQGLEKVAQTADLAQTSSEARESYGGDKAPSCEQRWLDEEVGRAAVSMLSSGLLRFAPFLSSPAQF